MKKVLLIAATTFALALGFNTHTSFASVQIKDTRAASAPETINGAPLRTEDKKTVTEKSADKSAADKKAAEKSASEANANIKANETASVATSAATASATKSTSTVVVPAASAPSAPLSVANNSLALSNIYRVGTGDVLDIRLLNSASRESTLFTVLADGTIDYPLAGESFNARGLTPEEIGAQLTSKIKLYDKPQISISVRDYTSHSVIVTGLVDNPGTKILRREAVPLYVVLAEAQPRLEAVRATLVRAGSPSAAIDLTDQTSTSTLVLPGDFIKVMAAPPAAPQFYFIGGQIITPGQKDFHAGLTLTQAVLAAGGSTRFAGNKIKVARQAADGRLATTEYNLKQIEEGKIPDPRLQPGDRIDVGRGRW